MEQRLIVEGKDAIFLGTLLKERGIPRPKGYENDRKFKKEFVKNAGGKSKINTILEEELNSPNVSNIGIVVDADNDDPKDILKGIISKIESTLEIKIDKEIPLTSKGAMITLPNMDLTVGIWIMPNNNSSGYLEHFIENLVPIGDPTLKFAKEKIDELITLPFSEITITNQQKAAIHTYLACKKEPGSPIGLGIKRNYFDARSASADSIVTWFQNTFDLRRK